MYDAFGKLAAEYDTSTAAKTKATKFLTTDHGSPRIVTNQTGVVVSRHDYKGYGDEIYAGVGGRTATDKYSTLDGVRQQFTGYERDTESGLDYAQARYYNSAHGRFTSVDPLTASATIKDPQTFNRYSYALNSPYKFTDPLGLAATPGGCDAVSSGSRTNPVQGPCQTREDIANQGNQQNQQQQNQQSTATTTATAVHPSCMNAGRCAATIDTTVDVTASVGFVGVGVGAPDGSNPNYVSPRTEMTFTLTDQGGQPVQGSVTETVTSTLDRGAGPQNAKTITNPGSETLRDGQFADTIDVPGGTMSANNLPDVKKYLENQLGNVNQTATFTVSSSNPYIAKGTITIVQTRSLGNFGSNGLNPPNSSGTRFVYAPSTLKATTAQ